MDILLFVLNCAADKQELFETKMILEDVMDDPQIKGKPATVFANKADEVEDLDDIKVSQKLVYSIKIFFKFLFE